MMIYEVNLTIDNDIFNDYYQWLIEHVETILTLPGFIKAIISKEMIAQPDPKSTKITVYYTVESEQYLDDYLANQAPELRADGIEKFGDKFSAFRRIFYQTCVVESNEHSMAQ